MEFINILRRGPSYLMGFFVLGLVACDGISGDKKSQYINSDAPEILRWALPEADNVEVLSVEPNECLPSSPTGEQILGRLAFRSPFLLGGQAARRGLTCQACHGQGQVNDSFFVVGLSDTPGTADVTSFHFSDVLGDESFNPVPIPSLSDDIEGVDYTPDQPDLDRFVRRLITKEFTGPEPSPQVQENLLSYLRGLSDDHCASPILEREALLDFQIKVVQQSFKTLMSGAVTDDNLDFMIAALRVELGRLYNRFPRDSALKTELANLSQFLKTASQDKEALKTVSDQWARLEDDLRAAYPRSLYHPQIIQDWTEARLQASSGGR